MTSLLPVSSDSVDDPFRFSGWSSCNIDLGSSSILDDRPVDRFGENLEETGSFGFDRVCEACRDRRSRNAETSPEPAPLDPEPNPEPRGENVPFRTRFRTTRFVLGFGQFCGHTNGEDGEMRPTAIRRDRR